jgi:hypothetical protein
LTGLEPVHQYDLLTPSFSSLNIKGRAWTYAIPLPFDTVVPYHFIGEALTSHIVSDVRLAASAVTLIPGQMGLTVLSCIHGLPRLAFVHLSISHEIGYYDRAYLQIPSKQIAPSPTV